VARRWGEIDETVDVLLPGGRLQVSWSGPGQPVWMSGPAAFVFEGTIKL
jgi:diaminopimelate epimerase